MVRTAVLIAALAGPALAAAPVPPAEPPAAPVGKFPPLDSKAWKDAGDGLKVWDAKAGDGPEVPAGGTVAVRYTGWLADGTEFDSNRRAAEPAVFPLGNLVKGWQLGLPGMKVGGVRRLVVPADLGYGKRGAPPRIPGNATLVFEVEVVGVAGR
jgi:FKBP-type peptidyl-prolyl cis-trans isomerase